MARQTPTPSAQGYRGSSQTEAYRGAFSDLANEIDIFWANTFDAETMLYESPDIFVVETAIQTACGEIHPEPNAFYCPRDRTIYLIPQFLIDKQVEFGDYAPITILSHEWGHHVQALLIIDGPTRKDFELQADCLMGVFTRHADEEGLLDYGDFIEALRTSEDAGDDWLLPEDAPGAHGQPEERVKALSRGYGGGPITGCELPFETTTSSETSQGDTRTPTPRSDDGREIPIPRSLPVAHASCFGIVDDGTEDFEQVLGRFSGVLDAEARLTDLGWQASAFRQFGCDGPPEGEAGWIDISVHQFADESAAQEAVDYFTAVRLDGSSHVQGASPGIGDYSTAMSGPAVNGKDFTVYASQGPILVRVTGVSPSGIPFMNVLTVAQATLAGQLAGPQDVPTRTIPDDWQPASAYLPTIPAVHFRECFDVLTEGEYDYADEITALQETGLTQGEFDALGWQDGAYIVFTCANPPVGRATQIDVGVHQFRDASAAQHALPHYAAMYEVEENMTRNCDIAGTLVVCVSGRSLTGSPLSDVAFVLQQVVATAGS